MSAKLRDEVLEVETASRHMHPFDDPDESVVCVVCADELFKGDRFVWRPEPTWGNNAIAIVHDYCAVKDGYRLSWVPAPPLSRRPE